MKDTDKEAKTNQKPIDEDSVISELQQAYKEIEAKRNTVEFRKIKHTVEQKILLKNKERQQETPSN